MGGMKSLLFALFVALLMVGCGESPKPSEGVDMTDTVPKKDAIKTAVDWSKLQDRSGVTYLPNTDKPFSGYAKRAYENEQIKELAQFKNGYIVRIKEWRENGTPKREATYKDNKREGLATEWDEQGRKEAEENYKDDKLHGLQTKYSRNGQKWSEINYKDGKRDGLMTWYDDNGQMRGEANFKEGYEDGLWTEWYRNGQKRLEENYKDGMEDGLGTKWYDNGQKESEGTYKDGKYMSAEAWKPNGEKCPVTNVKNGNGVLVLYKDDGTEYHRVTYKDGEEVED